MSYIVYARKWRPQKFEEVVGQEHITETLKNAIAQDRVAHAYIFSGPRGIGKTTTARILAKTLNCEKGPTPTPCGKCDSCIEITEGRSLDVIEIDGASNRGIEEVRSLRENVKFKPTRGKFKVYIIDEVHMLTPDAFNALLKTLEEPPAHVKFIFATTQKQKVIPTILSRCQKFDFKRIPVKIIVSKLSEIAKTEKLKISEDALFAIARACDGSMRDAESILDQVVSFCQGKIEQKDVIFCLGTIEEEMLFDIVESVASKNTVEGLKLVNQLVDNGKDLSEALVALLEYFRNLAVIKATNSVPGELIELPKDKIEKLINQSKKFSLEDLLYIFQVLNLTQEPLRRSKSARIVFEMCVFKLTKRESLMSLDEILKRIESLQSSTPDLHNATEPAAKEEECPGGNCPGGHCDEPASVPVDATADEPAVKVAVEEPPTTASPKAPPSGNATLDKAKIFWPEVLKKLKEEKMSAALFLLNGVPIKFENSILTVGFSEKFSFYKEALDRPENKNIVEKCLKQSLGEDARIEFIITYLADDTASENKLDIIEEPESPPGADFAQGGAPDQETPMSQQELSEKLLTEPIIQSALDIFEGRVSKMSHPLKHKKNG